MIIVGYNFLATPTFEIYPACFIACVRELCLRYVFHHNDGFSHAISNVIMISPFSEIAGYIASYS